MVVTASVEDHPAPDETPSVPSESTDDILESCRENRRTRNQTPVPIVLSGGPFDLWATQPSTSGEERRRRRRKDDYAEKLEQRRSVKFQSSSQMSRRRPTNTLRTAEAAKGSAAVCRLPTEPCPARKPSTFPADICAENSLEPSFNLNFILDQKNTIASLRAQTVRAKTGPNRELSETALRSMQYSTVGILDCRKDSFSNEQLDQPNFENRFVKNSTQKNFSHPVFDDSDAFTSSSYQKNPLNSPRTPLCGRLTKLREQQQSFNVRPFSSVIPILLSIILLQLSSTASALLVTPYDMQSVVIDGVGSNECHKALDRTASRDSGYIYSHHPYGTPYAADKICFLTIRVPKGYRIRLTVLEFIVPTYKEGCKKDTLHVFDHQTTTPDDTSDSPGPIVGQYCGRIKNGTVLGVSTLNVLTLWWFSDKDLPKWHQGKGFKLMWTAFRTPSHEEVCTTGVEFPCKNGECIPIQLGCDRVAHCLDGSDLDYSTQKNMHCDLSDAPGFLGLSEVAVGALCGAVVLGSVFVIVLLLICCRDICKKRASYEGATVHRREPEELAGPLVSKRTVQALDYCNRTHSSSSPNNTAYLNGSTSASMPYCINPRGKPQQGPSPNYLDNSHERMRFHV